MDISVTHANVQCQDLTPIILAAGFSSRMKEDGGAGIKALLTLSDGITFLEEIYRKMAEFSEKVIIVLGSDKDEILKHTNLTKRLQQPLPGHHRLERLSVNNTRPM